MTPALLTGMSHEDLRMFVDALGEKRFRADQIFSWIYAKGVTSFAQMTDLSREFRSILEAAAIIGRTRLVTSQTSPTDRTTKFLFALADGAAIESVLIPPEIDAPDVDKRLTLCVSTQVGCPLDCVFCATGTMGFTRNLDAGEIVDQVLQAQRNSPKRISNVVFMGMGEPMLNYENVMKSVTIMTDDRGLNIGPKHITISTAGYVAGIRRMAAERRKVKLALSLHALDEGKRTQLMPITRKHGIAELTSALDEYYRATRIRPTLEYIPFEGFNDTPADAELLIAFSKRIPCKVNLIPYHSIAFTHPGGFAKTLRPASRARIESFAERLRFGDVTVMIRSSSGEDINAACGQLAVQQRSEEQPVAAV